jgi:hypothetical protein
VWDSPVEAGEFYNLAGQAIEKWFNTKAKAGPASTVKAFSASGRSIQLTTEEIQGRPVVIYVDVPQGANPSIVQANRVTLAQ